MPMPKNVRELATELAKREGKRSQARIGDIREVIGHFSDLLYETAESESPTDAVNLVLLLRKLGQTRAKRRKKAR